MIIKKEKPQMVEFGELAPGDVFIEVIDGEEMVQMKTEGVVEDDVFYNTVDLVWGKMFHTKADRKVYRVVAELNIK